MNARDVEEAAATVRTKRRRAVHGVAFGAVIAIAGGAAVPLSSRLAIALCLGAACQALIALVSWLRRRELIERLALEPAAYTIPEVARFGSRATAPSELRRLAAWIRALLHDPQGPLQMHLAGRARSCADALEAIARDLTAPSSQVQPAIAVACRRLLTRPVQSPLYNPNLPEEDLIALLLRIRAGIAIGRSPAASR